MKPDNPQRITPMTIGSFSYSLTNSATKSKDAAESHPPPHWPGLQRPLMYISRVTWKYFFCPPCGWPPRGACKMFWSWKLLLCIVWWLRDKPWFTPSLYVVQSLSCVHLFMTPWTAALGLPVPQYLLEFTQVHVHWISNAIQPSHHCMTSP